LSSPYMPKGRAGAERRGGGGCSAVNDRPSEPSGLQSDAGRFPRAVRARARRRVVQRGAHGRMSRKGAPAEAPSRGTIRARSRSPDRSVFRAPRRRVTARTAMHPRASTLKSPDARWRSVRGDPSRGQSARRRARCSTAPTRRPCRRNRRARACLRRLRGRRTLRHGCSNCDRKPPWSRTPRRPRAPLER
jgi:hypothetical protein